MAGAEPGLQIEVIYSPGAGEVRIHHATLSPGARLSDAVLATGWFSSRQEWESAGLRVGVWGRIKDADAELHDRDRVELYRPLQVDPKEARRLRHRRHKQSLDQSLNAAATGSQRTGRGRATKARR